MGTATCTTFETSEAAASANSHLPLPDAASVRPMDGNAHKLVPQISVALVTRNRPDSLERTLRSLAAQSAPPFEVVISDDSGPEHTLAVQALARKYGCRYTPGPQRGLYANRNHAAHSCRGTHVRTMDDDHTFAPEHLARCLAAVAGDPTSVWIVGEYTPAEECLDVMPPCPPQLHPRGFSKPPSDPQRCWAIADGAAIYPCALFAAGVRFSDAFKFGASYLEFGSLLYHLGYRIRFLPDDYLIHHYAPGARSYDNEEMEQGSRFFAMFCHSFVYQPTLSNRMLTCAEVGRQMLLRPRLACRALRAGVVAFHSRQEWLRTYKSALSQPATPDPAAASDQNAGAGSSSPRLDFLDGIRGCAALTVCVGHALTFSCAAVFASWPWIGGLMHDAVALFIVLSGFCLMLPVTLAGGTLRHGAKAFFVRRAWRILPPYYAALLLSLILIWAAVGARMDTVWDYALPVTKMGVITHLALVHNFSHALEINGPLWSIAVEWQIYLLFPLFVLMFRRLGRGVAAAGIVVFSSVVFAATLPTVRFANVHPQFVGLFALGMLGADIAFARRRAAQAFSARVPWAACALLLGTLYACLYVALVWLGGGNHANYIELGDPLFGVFALTLLVAIVRGHLPGFKRTMEWTPLVWAGTISYSLYLIHLPLQALLWKAIVRGLPLSPIAQCLLLAGVGSALILTAAYGFHRACERPFMPGRPRSQFQAEPVGAEPAALVSPAP